MHCSISAVIASSQKSPLCCRLLQHKFVPVRNYFHVSPAYHAAIVLSTACYSYCSVHSDSLALCLGVAIHGLHSGPAHPFSKDGLAAGMRNHRAGHVEVRHTCKFDDSSEGLHHDTCCVVLFTTSCLQCLPVDMSIASYHFASTRVQAAQLAN